MRVLVTGGAGFIGHNLVKTLLSNQYQVNILDIVSNEDSRVKTLIQMGANYFQGDIRDLAAISKAGQGCSHVVHLAAQTSVSASMENKTLNDEINIGGTRNIIEFVNTGEIKKVVSASSAAVYGNCDQMPLIEESAGDCLSPYAESKFQNEQDLLTMVNDDIGVHVLRFFNVYGPGQGTDSNYAAVIPSFIDNIILGNSPTIFGDGNQSRDFIEVSDVISLILLILIDDSETPNDIYNVATQTETSIQELLTLIGNSVSQTESSIEIPPASYQSKRSGDIDSSCASISKVKSAFGWQPKIELKQGILSLVEYELRS
ncbi:MAG TPA: NAD-dependent epimerase/dehydratase family protein [Candidatus Poseidoniaceae archaeon]|nr:NAD-dependent epimerase/dehydratase family protein [Candidatus Poseidoniaceae archaeon]